MAKNNNRAKHSSLILVISLLLLLIAGCLALYPYVKTQLQARQNQKIVVATKNGAAKQADISEAKLRRNITRYNQLVAQQQQDNQIGGQAATTARLAAFKKVQTKLSQPLGFVTIPAINVASMPFYYGDDDWALAHGAGLLPWTSIPFGQKSTLAEITGHTGMSQVFFDNIRYLKKGDVFYLTVHNHKFAYQVTGRQVIDPNQPSSIRTSYAKQNHDTAALMTCTPRFINSHRLIIYGRRVPLQQAKTVPVKARSQWTPEVIMALLSLIPFLGILIIIILWWRQKRAQHE